MQRKNNYEIFHGDVKSEIRLSYIYVVGREHGFVLQKSNLFKVLKA